MATETDEAAITADAGERLERAMEFLELAHDLAAYRPPQWRPAPDGSHDARPLPAALMFLGELTEEIDTVIERARWLQRHLPPRPQKEERSDG